MVPRLVGSLILISWGCLAPGAEPRRDPSGDPLPVGALARLGTQRWRANSPIAQVAYVNDGKALLTVAVDYTVVVWDLASGSPQRQFDISGGGTVFQRPVISPFNGFISMSVKGDRLACIGRDGIGRVWDTTAGTEVLRFQDPARGNGRLALSRDGTRVATVSGDGAIRVWEVKPGAQPKTIGATGNQPGMIRLYPYRFDFGADNKTVMVGGIDFNNGNNRCTLVFWDLESGKETRRVGDLPGGQNVLGLMRCAISPDAARAAFPVGSDLILFDMKAGKEIEKFKDFGDPNRCTVAFSTDGKTLFGISGRADAIGVWDGVTGKQLKMHGKPPAAAPNPFNGVRMTAMAAVQSPDGRTLVWTDGPTVMFTDLESGKTSAGSEGHVASLKEAHFNSDGQTVVTRSQDSVIMKWNLATSKVQQRINVPSQASAAIMTRDEKWIIVAEPNAQVVRVLQASDLKEAHTVQPDTAPYGYTFGVSPDSTLLVMSSRNSSAVQLIDLATGKRLRTLQLPPPPMNNPGAQVFYNPTNRRLTFSPDSRLLAVSVDSQTPLPQTQLAVFEVATGRGHSRLVLPEGLVLRHCAFSPDCRSLACEFNGGEVSIWELATGTRRQTLANVPASVPDPAQHALRAAYDQNAFPMTLAYSPDGRLIARGGDNGQTVLWDVRTGRNVGAYQGHRGQILCANFAPDGRRLVTAGADTTALVWDLSMIRDGLPALGPIASESLDILWKRLGDENAERAHEAILAFAGDPAQFVPFARERIKPVPMPDVKLLERWIADLSDRSFTVRDKARRELEKLGELAGSMLREAAAHGSSAEARKLAQRLVEALGDRKISAEDFRMIRAFEALELAATPDAIALLQAVAAGAPDAPATIDARQALRRLAR